MLEQRVEVEIAVVGGRRRPARVRELELVSDLHEALLEHPVTDGERVRGEAVEDVVGDHHERAVEAGRRVLGDVVAGELEALERRIRLPAAIWLGAKSVIT